MPFVQSVEDEEEERRRQAAEGEVPQLTGAEGETTSGQALSGGQAKSAAGAPTGFTDVGSYLNANKEQATELANKLAGNLATKAAGLRAETEGLGQKFGTEIEGGTVNYNDELVSRAGLNPTEFIKNAGDVETFNKQRDASYGGPQSFVDREDTADLKNRISTNVTRAQGADTEAGRQRILYEDFQNPTKGQVTLDSLILGGDPNAANIVKEQGVRPYETLQSYLDQTTGEAVGKAQTAKDTTAGTKAKVAEKFTGEGGYIPQFNQDLQTRLGTFRTDAQKRTDDIKRILSTLKVGETPFRPWEAAGGNAMEPAPINRYLSTDSNGISHYMTPEENDLIGSEIPFGPFSDIMRAKTVAAGGVQSGSEYIPGKKFNLLDYTTTQNPEVSIGLDRFAGADDYSKAAALSQLSGADTSLFGGNAHLAGTASKDLLDTDFEGARSDIKGYSDPITAKFREQWGTKTPMNPWEVGTPTPPPTPPPPVEPPPPPYVPPPVGPPTGDEGGGLTGEPGMDEAFASYRTQHPEMDEMTLLRTFLSEWKNTGSEGSMGSF